MPLLTVARERGVFVRTANDDNHNPIPEDLSNYKVARQEDFVINKMKAWQGSLGLAPVDGIVSPAYFVFDADFAVPRFGEYLLRSKPYVAKFGAASDGVRVGQWDLNITRMRNIKVALPSADEQAAIVRYLAHANARIDKAIASKRRLIALLDEQMLAVTSELMKIEKARKIRAKDVCLQIVDCKNRTPDFVAGGAFHVVRTTCVRSGHFSMEGSYPTDEANYREWTQRGAPRAGDVLFTREAPAGEAALVPDRADLCLGQRMMYFRPNPDRVLPEYLLLAIYAEPARRFISVATNGSTVGHLRIGDVGALPLDLPALEVQRDVVEKHAREVATTRRTKNHISREIELLGEFRTRLVADVVTGHVDVRDIAASLPNIEPICNWDTSDPAEGIDPAEVFGGMTEASEDRRSCD
ncbi:restriction endonuclease subunit S [Mycobacterium sp. E3305]|uniref:restriction endonuclease subunit S n=1 Tax=Mycobacterium sp. E3305 TaxID=1834145 RepID=UPI00080047D3|nr:restriction endonuclease subunit S [Mycobacterium sp. E3305]OBG70282.1 hypothetical protein A5701_03575 [Mycobacterium sp. E3305]